LVDLVNKAAKLSAYLLEEMINMVASSRTIPSASPRKPGILVVDDDPSVRNFLDTALQLQGFAVWLAAGGLEAVQVYQQHSSAVDLALLDVRMPLVDGPQTLAAILRLDPQLRACFMTGQSPYSKTQLLLMGAAYVFDKPFQLAQMTTVLMQLLGQVFPPAASA
jgi:DNA-binding NtrC family response regulator